MVYINWTFSPRRAGNPGRMENMNKKMMLAILFGIIALLLLPFTALWAVFAYLAGYQYPLVALRGGDFDEAFDDVERSN